MGTRIVLVHGWKGNPDNHWFRRLRNECEAKRYIVITPQMPNPDHPKRDEGVRHLVEAVPNPDEATYFVGHSLGCITILRYFAGLIASSRVGVLFLLPALWSPLGLVWPKNL
ncbi:hypothetical protein COV04_03740 [Candidatus Uhrbacteria bacterium CG10_big_fil_rev_8_21_14_0_10_48_11]|uniref:AB hydrolase-1 domain-containing protein n=1 Tax=Candidatus Uhrbacteria bacterium CG10_big_fil_rev_8_21_14_0_10_48_11 TaxID=1975037 RepID=A0A2M8LE32_9BACT|nr:MAG: hypothetical protein COV04_03740 [Candidatus Uhrbacteria bacterium CG10_big_fil_rev_8_21_14_0_10_48_11]